MNERITIKGELSLDEEKGKVSEYDAEVVVGHAVKDSIQGTFGPLPDWWSGRLEKQKGRIAFCDGVQEMGGGRFKFSLSIDASYFDADRGGLEHLMNALCGDMLRPRVRGYTVKDLRVTDLLHPALEKHFKGRSDNSLRIRNAFRLPEDRPLLAFSFKPRVGVKPKVLKSVVLGVLKEGFNLVELDTRHLPISDGDVEDLLDVTRSVTSMHLRDPHRSVGSVAFAINLSTDPFRSISIVDRVDAVSRGGVFAVKVDGGLDGLSIIKEIKDRYKKSGRYYHPEASEPIITCYPLLRDQLVGRVPRDFFNAALTYRGADIIYPGGRPDVGGVARQLGTAPQAQLINAVRRYRKIIDEGYYLPSLAGGITAAELHAYYELFHGDAPFFLGGAVALHKRGPIAGAELCVEVLNEAVANVKKRGGRRKPSLASLPERLIVEVESAYEEEIKGKYIAPEQVQEKMKGMLYEAQVGVI